MFFRHITIYFRLPISNKKSLRAALLGRWGACAHRMVLYEYRYSIITPLTRAALDASCCARFSFLYFINLFSLVILSSHNRSGGAVNQLSINVAARA